MLKRAAFGYDSFVKKSFLFLAVFLVIFSAASGEDINGKPFFIKGKSEFDAGRYAGAIENLSEAYKRLPVVRDYILFYLSRAYSESGNISESDLRIKELLKDYPSSPLRKKVRRLEIKNLIASGEMPHNPEILESYVRDYSEDNEMKFLFAKHLRDKGETERARAIFKTIYLSSEGLFSKISYNELAASDITPQDIIEKAANLTNVTEFKKAESALREALAKDDGQRRIEIIKKLGYVLFKQKRYKESADAYGKAGDHYLKAKALYRAGDKTGFDRVLKKLSLMDDKRTGSLLILAALDKRRNGEIGEALNLYQTIKVFWLFDKKNDYDYSLTSKTVKDSILINFVNPYVAQRMPKVRIENLTGENGVAEDVSKILEIIGFKTADYSKGYDEKLDCEVIGSNKNYNEIVSKIFNCQSFIDLNQTIDLKIRIGKSFSDRF